MNFPQPLIITKTNHLKNNAYDNDQTGSSKGYRSIEDTIEEIRYYTNNRKAYCTDEDNVIKDF